MKQILFIFNVLLFLSIYAYGGVIEVAIPDDVYVDYMMFVGNQDPLQIEDFTGDKSRRDVVEVVLLQQALSLGGFDGIIEFIMVPTYLRMQKVLKDGAAVVGGTTMWLTDIEQYSDGVFSSISTVENGEFEAGFYALESNKRAMLCASLEDIRQLRGVSNRSWTADWKTLSMLKLKRLYHTYRWPSMVQMVGLGRADFLLAPFQPTKDFALVVGDVRLVPIPGLKLGLNGRRSFAVSKVHPKGKEIYEILNIGLERLKKHGVVKRAYQESGFFNIYVEDWKKIE